MTVKTGLSKLIYEWQLSYTKAVFSFVQKAFCGFCWYVRVWCFSCLCELVVYQASQPSKQNLDSSDNDVGADYLFDWAWRFFNSKQATSVTTQSCKWLFHMLHTHQCTQFNNQAICHAL